MTCLPLVSAYEEAAWAGGQTDRQTDGEVLTVHMQCAVSKYSDSQISHWKNENDYIYHVLEL